MDRASQALYHSLIKTGALGEGAALSPPTPEAGEDSGAELVFRTTSKDWILVAATEPSRGTFLQLAQAAMGHAIDMSEVAAETGIVFAKISPDLKSTSDRLHIATFKVNHLSDPGTCGFCGSAMTAPAKLAGWQGCARCQRLLKEDSSLRICSSCLGAFSCSPALEDRIKSLLGDAAPLPDLTACALCRSPDHHSKVTVIDLIMKAVGEGRVTLDQVKALKMPAEYLQLLNLRVQLRRT